MSERKGIVKLCQNCSEEFKVPRGTGRIYCDDCTADLQLGIEYEVQKAPRKSFTRSCAVCEDRFETSKEYQNVCLECAEALTKADGKVTVNGADRRRCALTQLKKLEDSQRTRWETKHHLANYMNLMDVALISNDKEWFNELQRKYQREVEWAEHGREQ